MRSARLRVGILGASPSGSWGSRAHIPVLQGLAQFELKGICNARIDTAREAARIFGADLSFGEPAALASHPEIDAVLVCVRAPLHFELVQAAVAPGKPIYCEWPLARDTAEAEAMVRMAQCAGAPQMAGLQARHSPALAFLRDLIGDGAIGEVHATTLIHSGSWFVDAPGFEYLQDWASGAHFLSIPGGHSLDAVCWTLGEFTSVQATLARIERGAALEGTSTNQIVIAGRLADGAVACIRLQGAPSHGTGLWWEINGSRGDLVVTGRDRAAIQMAELSIRRTTAPGRLEEIAVPDRYFSGVPDALRAAPLINLAKAWVEFHSAIVEGRRARPDFADALGRHRTLDIIKAASDAGRRIEAARDTSS